MNVMAQFPAARDYDRDLRFRAMFEGAAIGIAICQFDGRVLEANPAMGRMLGYSPRELTGTHALELYAEHHRETNSEAGAENRTHDFSNADISHDEISQDKHLMAELLQGERESFEIEKHYRRKDGSDLWIDLTVSLARDAHRQPTFLVAFLADANERKRAAEHLREAEKMEVIGRLAGGIAHDFNNLLTGILLYCDLLTSGLESKRADIKELDPGAFDAIELQGSELIQHVEEMRMAGEQGAALTHQLLAIARKQAPERRPVPINDIVASMKNLLRRLISEQIELIISLDSSLDSSAGMVLADPAQLRQVLLNLVLNARDAIPHGGKITLSTQAAEFPGRESAQRKSVRRAVSLVIKDNGCGMDAETRTRLFEPFFTTKRPGKGTGLGLATVQRIVSEAGGLITVESEPGCGACIQLFFPALDSPADMEVLKSCLGT